MRDKTIKRVVQVLAELIGTDAIVFIHDDIEETTADVYIASEEFVEILMKKLEERDVHVEYDLRDEFGRSAPAPSYGGY